MAGMLLGRRTPVTTLLLALIGIAFLGETVLGGSTNPDVLELLGANFPPRVLQGHEYWRLVASMFLHIGFVHLLVNGWALYQLGSLFEILLGSGRLLLVYFLSGIAGSLASVMFTRSLSAGASGAIFGLLGALIAFLLKRRGNLTPQAKSLLMQLLFWAGLNVFLGFSTPGIDNAAHLGGCAAGFLLGLGLREKPRYNTVEEF
ncbi:MAG TPA: rhomboid family intramembrane serine protease [Thermoanaerobaculia bacterium]|jgi:rhomboid protease GluP|nr:rhomboid family intramembrane serine protease [Thermoanaerobaculia bacterium]